MALMPTVGMIGAFDTKDKDYACIYRELESNGCKVVAINIAIRASSVSFPVDVTAEELFEHPSKLEELRAKNDRPAAVKAMKEALQVKIVDICKKYGIVALIGAGGTNGTDIITSAMQRMERSMPKLCITTVAQHENWEFTKTANIRLIDSCVDVGGLNDISRDNYEEAALVIATLARRYMRKLKETPSAAKLPAIGVSMFGNTTDCVKRCSEIFQKHGFQVMPFHAVGTGGKNLEALVRDGTIRGGVLDLTLQEVTANLVGGIYSAGSTRLTAAGDTKTPQVVVPGCVDMVMLGKLEEAEKRFPGRRFKVCNPNLTAMRTNVEENKKSAHDIAQKVNAAFSKGCPVAVLIPSKGFSMFDETLPGWHDPEANKTMISELVSTLHSDVKVQIISAHINDPVFADAASDMLLQLIKKQKQFSSLTTQAAL